MTSDDAIGAVERWLGAPLPPEYVAFLAAHPQGVYGDRVVLYEPSALIERNETFQSKEYCPGYFIIGNDGGGYAVVIPLDRPLGDTFLVDHGAMTPDCFEKIALPFRDWLARGCPLPRQPPRPTHVDVYLDRSVPLAILVRIKNELAFELETTELLRASKRGEPVRLLRAAPFGISLVRCRAVNAEHDCLSMRRVDSPDERVEWPDGAGKVRM